MRSDPADAVTADGLMQAAVDTMVARDLKAARALIRRAVTIGHVDGALIEVAMTANGSGSPADWRGALALLRKAAVADPVAERQLALVEAMAIDPDGAPKTFPSLERLSDTPDVVRLPRLLSRDECTHLAGAVQDILEPSHVVDPATGKLREHPIRTSDGAVIGPTREDLVVRAINMRVAAVSGTQVDQGEALSVLRYRPAQQFRLHHDAIGSAKNQRIKTVLIYLNDGFVGGETYFPKPDLTIAPAAGDAIMFVNIDAAGRPDPRADHAGLPVTQGVKWLATRWIRARPFDMWAGPEAA
ncbi:2OG-Fe(II) oxygenase [Sphingomonas sp. Tas61C01]|uniref:2OG-Fe(II) oxygenase n=1 Tax=Sphingomonas sp. Tas61C01 TaxID=3458297 RepID=UPI00403E9397